MMEKKWKAILSSGTEVDAEVTINSKPIPKILFLCDNLHYEETGRTVYEAMQKLHKKLDGIQVKLLCNCFRFDVRPSGMALSMGQGTLAYIMELGKQATEQVDIFEPYEDVNAIVSYEEQEIFYQKWIRSL